MNLFVSLVLDTFLIKWEAVHGASQDGEGTLDPEGENFNITGNWEGSSFFSGDNLVSPLIQDCMKWIVG